MKAKAYQVINAWHLRGLEALVTRCIVVEGWEPIGGVHSVPAEKRMAPVYQLNPDMSIDNELELETDRLWFQAMVLRE